MAELNKTGLIPASNAVVYKENFRISDEKVGKYISLNGFKRFHNPGIGLDLSVPNTDTEIVTYTYKSLSNSGEANASASSYGTMSYLFLPTKPIITNTLSGVGNTDTSAIMNGIGNSDAENLNAYSPPAGSPFLIKAQQAGTYNITFTAIGSIYSTVSNGSFTANSQFFVRINGVDSPLNTKTSSASPGGKTRPQGASTLYNFSYSASLPLAIGDTVQIYGKVGVSGWNGANHTIKLSVGSVSCLITMDSTKAPSQTYFSNPQNIAQLNIKGINYYGNSRDSLKLIGNKLTS